MKKLLLGLVLALVSYGQQPNSDTLSMSATPPSGVSNVSVSTTGVRGGNSYCYWVVAVFPGGMAGQVNKAACLNNSNGTLTGGNYNTVFWNGVTAATGYWVLRTVGNSFPGTGTVAVNTTVLAGTTTSLADQSNTLHAFTYLPMANVNATFRLVNTGSFVFPNVIGDTAYNITFFADLPAASSKAGILYVVYDSPSATSCSGGGGTGTPSLCLSNGVTWIPMATSVSGGTTTIQTNGVNNTSQNPVNFVNSAAFNGLTLTFTNTAGGIVQLGASGLLASGGMSTTGVTAGSYTNTNLTVDAQGRITAAANGTGGGGSGTVTNFSSGNFAPLFTVSVANPTTTPALTFNASNFSADNILGNFTASPAAPSTQAIPACANDGVHALVYVSHVLTCAALTTGGAGTVTAISWTGGIVSIANPTTTPAFTIAGNSGGIPYFSSGSTWASSGVLGANLPLFGGGAGAAPIAGTRSGNTTQVVTTTGAQTSGDCVKIDASGNHIANGSPCGSGGGVTTFSAGNLSPLFTTAVTNPTTTPSLAFTLSNFAADNIYGNFTGGSAAPSTQTIPSCANDGSHALVYVGHVLTCGVITGGSGSSVFDGSYAQTQSFSATPSVDLVNITGPKSPTRIEMGTLTGNVISVTFLNIPSSGGAKFSLVWKQDGTGSHTVAYGVTVTGNCTIDPTPGITTTQEFEVTSITTINGTGCTTDHTGVEGGPEGSTPISPVSGNFWRWVDSTTHVPNWLTQAGTFNAIIASTCAGGTVVTGYTAAGVAICSASAGTLTIASGAKLIDATALGAAGAIAANACAANLITVSATGVASTDVIGATFNADVSGVTGYGVASTDGLIVYPYPTANNVNFKVCNATGSSITAGTVTLNYRVTR